MKLKLLVTGTGRCGTVYMARWLTTLGMPCGHESIYDFQGQKIAKRRLSGDAKITLSFCSTSKMMEHGDWESIPEWLSDTSQIVADSSYMAAPFLKSVDCPVLHVVRNPVKVVNSFVNHIDYFKSNEPTNQYEQFIYKYLPELCKVMPQYDRAVLFYVLWNKMIERHADFRWPVEGDPDLVMQWLGVQGDVFEDRAVNTFSARQSGSRQFHVSMIKDQDILEQLLEMSERYGYRLKNLL